MNLPKIPWWGWTLGAGAVAVGILVWRKVKANKAASAPAPSSPATAPASSAGSADQSPLDSAYLQDQAQQQQSTADIVSAIQALQPNSANASSASPAGYSTAPYTGETYIGGGYDVPAGMYGFIDPQGNAYERLANWADAYQYELQLSSAGKPAGLYYQPTPGVAQLANVNALDPNVTPLYIKVPQGQSAIGEQATESLAS